MSRAVPGMKAVFSSTPPAITSNMLSPQGESGSHALSPVLELPDLVHTTMGVFFVDAKAGASEMALLLQHGHT